MNSITLIHFNHCPFCMRIRLALGFKKFPWVSHVIGYHDIALRQELSGANTCPIVLLDGNAMNESIDIMQTLDDIAPDLSLAMGNKQLIEDAVAWRNQLKPEISFLAHSCSPEFEELRNYPDALKYYSDKVQKGYGITPPNMIPLREENLTSIIPKLDALLKSIDGGWYQSEHITGADMIICSDLYPLSRLGRNTLPAALIDYFDRVQHACHCDLDIEYPMGKQTVNEALPANSP